MPKEKALQGQRLLTAPIPSLKLYWDGAGEVSSTNSNLNGWQSAPSSWPVAQPTFAYYETYFDLSGYELGDLTLVPTVMETQDLGFMTLSGAAMSGYSPRFTLVDIISQERLDPTELEDDFINREFTLPGDPQSTEDWVQVIMENGRTFTPTSISTMNTATYVHMVPSSGGSKGSGSPTTVQKLWVYRLLFLKGATTFAGVTLQIPSARTILGASIIKEPDLEYLMRQKRSYELATRKD